MQEVRHQREEFDGVFGEVIGMKFESAEMENGSLALMEALGPVGMVRFLQNVSKGDGDYTKERSEQTPLSMEEVMASMDAVEDAMK